MSRGVKGLHQLISQSRQVHIDDSSGDEQTDNHCQATNALSNHSGQFSGQLSLLPPTG